MTARLWIVRHGNTFEANDPPRRIGARTDLALTGEGRAQAARLAARFAAAGLAFGRVLSGPLSRTRETAAIVAGRAPEIMSFLAEIDHGPDEGRDEAAVIARIGPDALARWDADAVPPPGWIVDADARLAAWRALAGEAEGDLLLATSNGAARFAPLALGLRPPPSFKLRTGAYARIDIAADGAMLACWDVRPPS